MAGGSGGMGKFRLGAKRISWPDWVRADAIESVSTTSENVSDTDVVADSNVSIGRATGSESNSISIAIGQGVNGEGEADSPTPQINTITIATNGVSKANSTIPIISTVADSDTGEGEADSPVPTIETIHNAQNGNSNTDLPIPTVLTVHNAEVATGNANSSIPTIDTTADGENAIVNADGSIGIVTWNAGLGGVIKDPDGKVVEGAEVHIIRDNDNKKMTSTETNKDGRWHVTLPGGKTTNSDPPVYSIEVWYRDGPKRSSSATVYNAKNRPFIDTSDPSETNPYTK